MKEPIPPGASVILTVEGSMTAIHAPVSVVRGYRQSQTIQVGTRFPLHRSSSLCHSHGMRQKEQSIRFTLILTMRIATNLLSTDNVSCIQDAMRACLTSVWTESGDDNVDGSSYNDYFVHPFSVQSMQSEPYLMMCIHGSSENCSSLLPEAERESWKRKYSLSSIPWGSLEVVCFLVVLVVILLIVLFNIVSIRNDIHFLESLFSLD